MRPTTDELAQQRRLERQNYRPYARIVLVVMIMCGLIGSAANYHPFLCAAAGGSLTFLLLSIALAVAPPWES